MISVFEEMSLLDIKSAKDVMVVSNEDRILPLDSKGFWLENDLCVCFGPAGVGKSIFAVGLAAEISKTLKEKVVYFDFELSDREFMLRFTRDFLGDYFFRGRPSNEDLMTTDGKRMAQIIEQIYLEKKIKYFVVDNISIILDDPTNYDKAKRFILEFKGLVDKYQDMSILLVGHTPKRDMAAPISSDSLAGSKALTNFCKSAFAIIQSVKGSNIIYVKQVKTRNGECLYDANNVLVYTLIREKGNLLFKELGTGKESDHLYTARNTNLKENEVRDEMIIKLYNQTKSTREISKILLEKKGIRISHTAVNQVVRRKFKK